MLSRWPNETTFYQFNTFNPDLFFKIGWVGCLYTLGSTFYT